jgi:hypothetical protein
MTQRVTAVMVDPCRQAQGLEAIGRTPHTIRTIPDVDLSNARLTHGAQSCLEDTGVPECMSSINKLRKVESESTGTFRGK